MTCFLERNNVKLTNIHPFKFSFAVPRLRQNVPIITLCSDKQYNTSP